MSRIPHKKRRLNRLGKVTLTIFILLIMLLMYFSWELISSKKVEADNSGLTKINKPKGKDEELIGETKPGNMNTEKSKHKSEQQIIDKENNEVNKPEKPLSIDQDKREKENEESKVELEIGKVVYLTFDDGPHATASMEILQLLDKYNAKATYFMLEPHMKRNPDIVTSMKEKGHTIGVHGVTHDVSQIYKSPENFVNEMAEAINFIQETTGINTHLIRAPYGSKPYITAPFKEASDKNDFILWDWNVDSNDWKLKNGEFVNHTIQQINNLAGKEPLVVLMHEKTTTAAHLEKLLQFLQINGYEMKAVDELMEPMQFK